MGGGRIARAGEIPPRRDPGSRDPGTPWPWRGCPISANPREFMDRRDLDFRDLAARRSVQRHRATHARSIDPRILSVPRGAIRAPRARQDAGCSGYVAADPAHGPHPVDVPREPLDLGACASTAALSVVSTWRGARARVSGVHRVHRVHREVRAARAGSLFVRHDLPNRASVRLDRLSGRARRPRSPFRIRPGDERRVRPSCLVHRGLEDATDRCRWRALDFKAPRTPSTERVEKGLEGRR